MPHPKNRKRRTRQKILEAATRLFSAKGFDATSIEEVMLECGLTRGGFYAHFRSKGQLYLEAVTGMTAGSGASAGCSEPSVDWLKDLFAACERGLDQAERAHPAWTLLATDVASKAPEVRQGYSRALQTVRDIIRDDMSGSQRADEAALAATAMIVGALAIVSTIDDGELKTRLTEACHKATQALLEGSTGVSAQPTFLWSLHDEDSARSTGTSHALH